MVAPLQVLIVDDKLADRMLVREAIGEVAGLSIRCVSKISEARLELETGTVDVALVDVCMGDFGNKDGLTLIGEIARNRSAIPIVVSGSNRVDYILEAGRLGAVNYLFKDNLDQSAVAVIERCKQARDYRLRDVLGIVGKSAVINKVRADVLRFAAQPGRRPIMILGPTGSGKGLIAAKIHEASPERDEPFYSLNCGASAREMINSEIFGHLRGSFTSAYTDRIGAMEAAGRGTLFLDEIAELDIDSQATLLTAIEQRKFRKLGSPKICDFRARLIVATHRNLEERIEGKLFREDLYFRLNVLTIRIPSLAERREDIPLLVEHYNQEECLGLHFTDGAMEWLCTQPWRGNVRQLNNMLERVAAEGCSEVTTEILEAASEPRDLRGEALRRLGREILSLPINDRLDATENTLIELAMDMAKGCKTSAAAILGIHRKSLYRKLAWLQDLRWVQNSKKDPTDPE